MPRGETTTIRPPQGEGRALPEWRRVIGRNATLTDLDAAKGARIGTTFTIEAGDMYRIEDVKRDTLHRLIAIGKLAEREATA